MSLRRGLPSTLLLAALPFVPADLFGQIRPLDPLDLCTYHCGRSAVFEAGAAAYVGQRASLAGAEGLLVELGSVRVLWRLDRVAFEASGTVWRRFESRRVFAEAVGGAAERPGRRRSDVGDFRLATVLTLARTDRLRAILRFGTRLPTTDDGAGLERDRTDFFALVGGQYRRGALTVTAESGIGIYGTRGAAHDQVDVWLYSTTVEYEHGALVPGLSLVGQADGLRGESVRGNEDLREVRAGLRVGRRRWARLAVVRGLSDFSPRLGLALTVGASF